jgi:hypothetical protein
MTRSFSRACPNGTLFQSGTPNNVAIDEDKPMWERDRTKATRGRNLARVRSPCGRLDPSRPRLAKAMCKTLYITATDQKEERMIVERQDRVRIDSNATTADPSPRREDHSKKVRD